MKIGMSLSFCVADIARGLVKEEEVLRIIASTCAKDLEIVLEQYQTIYWNDLPGALDIARRLISEGKVDQPRLENRMGFNIANGHWAEVTKL